VAAGLSGGGARRTPDRAASALAAAACRRLLPRELPLDRGDAFLRAVVGRPRRAGELAQLRDQRIGALDLFEAARGLRRAGRCGRVMALDELAVGDPQLRVRRA